MNAAGHPDATHSADLNHRADPTHRARPTCDDRLTGPPAPAGPERRSPHRPPARGIDRAGPDPRTTSTQ